MPNTVQNNTLAASQATEGANSNNSLGITVPLADPINQYLGSVIELLITTNNQTATINSNSENIILNVVEAKTQAQQSDLNDLKSATNALSANPKSTALSLEVQQLQTQVNVDGQSITAWKDGTNVFSNTASGETTADQELSTFVSTMLRVLQDVAS